MARGRRALRARIEMLTSTRRQAVVAQAAELRRIERDLHDGAQARLVALTLQLGRAEMRAGEPEVRELIKDAQREASYAIAELRDLARGIVPPLLADRGLVAAVESLAARYGLGTTIVAETHRSLAPAVESAAYFVIAEALTNTAKHAEAQRSWVRLSDGHRELAGASSATTAAAAPTETARASRACVPGSRRSTAGCSSTAPTAAARSSR